LSDFLKPNFQYFMLYIRSRVKNWAGDSLEEVSSYRESNLRDAFCLKMSAPTSGISDVAESLGRFLVRSVHIG